ncbi:hypothetical protein R1flu_016363 [Riccia fluitans]|uniref:Secreted protein n=1 Tax=Riccia fluitans TaxID=41844 RepID=A0ABD1YPQ9_9MARC
MIPLWIMSVLWLAFGVSSRFLYLALALSYAPTAQFISEAASTENLQQHLVHACRGLRECKIPHAKKTRRNFCFLHVNIIDQGYIKLHWLAVPLSIARQNGR